MRYLILTRTCTLPEEAEYYNKYDSLIVALEALLSGSCYEKSEVDETKVRQSSQTKRVVASGSPICCAFTCTVHVWAIKSRNGTQIRNKKMTKVITSASRSIQHSKGQ